MPDSRITLLQSGGQDLSDDEITELYAVRDRSTPWLRVNFIASIDGAATSDGLSEGLGTPADRRVFDILRRLCDVVVVGAGTVRAEGYGPMRLDPPAVAWRADHSLPEHPVFAIVSAGLDLDPASPIFADAPVRPIVVTVTDAPADRMAALARVADVLIAGESTVDTATMRSLLADRDLRQIHCEGGPRLFTDLIRDDAVDEVCLTVGPTLEGPGGRRIVDGDPSGVRRRMDVAHVLNGDGTLLLRYVRQSV